MKKHLIILFTVITAISSYGRENRFESDLFISIEWTSENTMQAQTQKQETVSIEKFIDTRYEYSDPEENIIIIENSYPKGGLEYTDSYGIEYVYAIFWTRIINETGKSIKLNIGFPPDQFSLPSSADNYFKLFIPSDEMTSDKAGLFNYGLKDLNTVLDNKLQKSSSLDEIIESKEICTFYVVALFRKGVNGTVRAGLSLKDSDLIYRINDKVIPCGHIIK